MGFEIDNLKWFRGISNRKSYDHCWNQNKTMLLSDDVTTKLVLVIKLVTKVIQNQHQSAVYR